MIDQSLDSLTLLAHLNAHILEISLAVVSGVTIVVTFFFKALSSKLPVTRFEDFVKQHEEKHAVFEAKIDSKLEKIQIQFQNVQEYMHTMRNDVATIAAEKELTRSMNILIDAFAKKNSND